MNVLLSISRKLGLVFMLIVSITILTACTTPIYNVAFLLDGEEVSYLEALELEEGSTFLEPRIAMEIGHTFSGWYLESDLINIYDFTKGIEEDITLYGNWTPNDYTITFETNGGEEIEAIEQEFDTPIPLVEPIKEGHSFLRWYYDSDITDVYDQEYKMPDNDITLNAIWQVNDYTITLLYSETYVIAEGTFSYGTRLTDVQPTMTGHEFYGWFLDIELTTPYNVNNPLLMPGHMPAYDITLYAGFRPIEQVDCDIYPDDESCVIPVTDVVVLDELPTEDIVITFWHVYGQSKSALLDEYIAEFEALYPNVTINSISKGSYTDLRNQVILSIVAGVSPTIVVGYSEDISGYLNGDAVIPLDDFITDETFGRDIDNYIQSYVEENNQYEDGLMYSVPYSKSTEVVVINKTIFEANGLTVKTDAPYTWAELDALALILVGDGPNQCEYLINYDSASNFFINSLNQWGGEYTNSNGEVLLDNSITRDMLTYIQARFNNNTFAIPLAWDQNYGSTNFLAEDVCMTVTSSAGVIYNIPGSGEFEVAIAPVPQYDLDNMSVIQQGPNIAIMDDTTDAERLAAWLFITYLTNTENTTEWAMLTNYLPVSDSAYDSVIFQDFLVSPTVEQTYQSMTANAALLQKDYFYYEPAFSNMITSTNVRTEVGRAIEALFAGSTPEEVITQILNNLGIN